MRPLHPHDPPSVGPYRLHSRLGEDACARVYLGSTPGGPPTAVRVVRSEYATDARFRSVFGELVESGHRLESERVCAVRAADLRGAVPWVAVERPYGMTLTELVGEVGPLTVDAVHAVALHLALGLDDLHAAGRAHGSLWPDGVLITTERALLADPGLEWAVADVDRRAPHPSFAAPEGGVGPGVDVFAWAATVSFAASGVEGPEGLARVPLQLRGLVEACLRNGPILRPVAADLVRMLGGPRAADPWPPEVLSVVRVRAGEQRDLVVAAGDAPLGEETGRRPEAARRRRIVAVTAGAVALAAIAATGLWAHGGDGDPAGGETTGPVMSEGADCAEGVAYPAPEAPLDGAEVPAWATAFSPDGSLLAVLTDGGLGVWDWRAGEEIARLTEVGARLEPVFSPTGCLVAAGVERGFEGMEFPVTMVTTFDLPSGTTFEHLGPQKGPSGPDGVWVSDPRQALHAGFSPEGSLMTITLDTGLGRAGVGLVDTATGEALAAMVPERTGLALLPDPGRVVTANGTELTVWDARDGRELHTVRDSRDRVFTVVPGTDEIVHVSGDRSVWWDYVRRREVRSFAMEGYLNEEWMTRMEHLSLSPDGTRLYADWYLLDVELAEADRHTSYVWDVETGEDLLSGVEDPLRFVHVAAHPDGETLMIVTPENRVVPVDAETLEPGEPLF
ncbi:acyl-ACP thioesterase [Nocardiopsis sp. N85]|uniref:acyl-ACP thioesterase n=1 Tax=Nocardiopsis sp. N85 TaxID=3029400 RepID=UPI00237F9691|nr:acyl-ACP thioesterase [Nocardiopsis sp. N85]MDE3723064.1 acyl-ACP thioesterase [Nocardiopsis sp. N85]